MRLLGSPAIERDEEVVRLAGRKSWGLLAYLLLETQEPTRRELAGMLTGESDDPLASLRWHLLQVRRAIEPAEIVETSGRLGFRAPEDCAIDVHDVLAGTVSLDRVGDLGSGQLLEGMSFDDAPTFDLWLSLQRARIGTACADVLRWSATTLSRGQPMKALPLIALGLRWDPFDDSLHQLAVETHVAMGDTPAAEQHIERVIRLYRDELGAEPDPAILRALVRATAVASGASVPEDVRAEMLIEMAQTRLDGADFDGALDAARRAASAAAASGEEGLEARALMTLAGALIHTIHGRDHESFGLLARAHELATRLGDPALLAEIERELGFVGLIDARYGAAEACLTRSIDWAAKSGSAPLAAMSLTFRGLGKSDRTDYVGAERDLHRAIADLAPEEYRGFRGYARATLARVLLRTGRIGEAREAARLALEENETGGMHGSMPWALSQLGEATLLDGDPEEALRIFERAFALALEFADPCWESLTQRGLALCALGDGRSDDARALLVEALGRARRVTDTYHWAEALILTDLVEVEGGSDADHLRDALRLARAAPMPDFVARLAPFVQTSSQTPVR